MELTELLEAFLNQSPSLAILIYLLFRLDKRLEEMQRAYFDTVKELIDKIKDDPS